MKKATGGQLSMKSFFGGTPKQAAPANAAEATPMQVEPAQAAAKRPLE